MTSLAGKLGTVEMTLLKSMEWVTDKPRLESRARNVSFA